MTKTNLSPAKLLEDYLPLLEEMVLGNGILDLACGSGRNGIFLARHNLPVVFADINPAALQKISDQLGGLNAPAQIWQVDFEDPESGPLAGKQFDAILVFNYLHRPLIPAIRNSLVSGGLLFYETFTAEQATIGRPGNPEYLLNPGELRSWFDDWSVLHYYEGYQQEPQRFFANLVARKPAGSV